MGARDQPLSPVGEREGLASSHEISSFLRRQQGNLWMGFLAAGMKEVGWRDIPETASPPFQQGKRYRQA